MKNASISTTARDIYLAIASVHLDMDEGYLSGVSGVLGLDSGYLSRVCKVNIPNCSTFTKHLKGITHQLFLQYLNPASLDSGFEHNQESPK